MKTHRKARIAEVIREVAAETILFELSDPRIKGVTVTRAEVSGDLQHAKVHVSLMGSPKDQHLCMYALTRSAGYIQAKLGSRLKSRFTPVIHFVLDEGVKKSIEVSRLINEALAQPGPAASDLSADAPAPVVGAASFDKPVVGAASFDEPEVKASSFDNEGDDEG